MQNQTEVEISINLDLNSSSIYQVYFLNILWISHTNLTDLWHTYFKHISCIPNVYPEKNSKLINIPFKLKWKTKNLQLSHDFSVGPSGIYLRHISDKYEAYLKQSSGIFQAYLKHIRTICQACIKDILSISLIWPRQLSRLSSDLAFLCYMIFWLFQTAGLPIFRAYMGNIKELFIIHQGFRECL